MSDTKKNLVSRITEYLAGGGLFNPELAVHDNVRNLLMDCREVLQADDRPSCVHGNELLCFPGSKKKWVHWDEKLGYQACSTLCAPAETALLKEPNSLPEGCYCKSGQCMAPVVMGRQMPCRDPQKAALASAVPQPEQKRDRFADG